MLIEIKSGHIAFGYEEYDEFFELGDKVLKRQKLENVIEGLHVQYNMRDRLLYDIEQYVSVNECIHILEENDMLNILTDLIDLIFEVESNGFIPVEAVQVDTKTIFWNEKEKRAYFIVLPISKECNIKNCKNWHKRMQDTLNELCAVLNPDLGKIIEECISQKGGLKVNLEELHCILDDYRLRQSIVDTKTTLQECQKELRLIHDGKYGYFVFYIQKKEFIIGKRRDSVDGFLGVSDAVSRVHCKIVRRGKGYFVSDMGSSNHTFVNGTLLDKYDEKELFDGDSLRIADVEFTVGLS